MAIDMDIDYGEYIYGDIDDKVYRCIRYIFENNDVLFILRFVETDTEASIRSMLEVCYGDEGLDMFERLLDNGGISNAVKFIGFMMREYYNR